MSSRTSQLEDLPVETQALEETRLPHVRRLVADTPPRESKKEPAATEQSANEKKPSSRGQRFVNMPLWDFLIILSIFVAIGYVIGAAHQYAALM